jgi:hypothetical protein
VNKRASLLLLLLLPATMIQGCNPSRSYCPKGTGDSWRCVIQPTNCHYPMVFDVCANSMAEAIATANSTANTYLLSKNPFEGTTCMDNGNNVILARPGPPFVSQDMPSCDVTETDDACTSCAKSSCCGQYQACFQDANCACLVGCLYQGGTTAACTAADSCGAASSVSVSTAACLATSCAAQCNDIGTMGSGMCPPPPDGTGGGSTTGSTSTGGTCTPGSAGPGEPCFSNGDCSSCACNTGTMTCN